MLEIRSAFPSFSLVDQEERLVRLADLKGRPAVIYFYPKDDTPGCTAEACDFRDRMQTFEGVSVLGVSPDTAASHRKFAAKFGLTFPLLADTGHLLAEACGVWVEKSLYGRTYMGVERTTFLLDPDGLVARIWRKVKPEGHAAEVAEALREIESPA
ncbi:MAG: peroxiredoxin [Fimbriimonas ginsengisoli]|uniref:thioredoxin-dependent peroxiredoxin n=1 Tax=Fimbriimonas ginsengisoli TaxID=1005039 RepID=A0A931PVQ6_FIMGI|nr:peroxiredoxin [Fimbriimonas ginsengisoli]